MENVKKVAKKVGTLAFFVAVAMNVQYALDDYGLFSGVLTKFVLAQNTNTNTNTNTSTSTSTNSEITDPAILKIIKERFDLCYSKSSGLWDAYQKYLGSKVAQMTTNNEGQLGGGVIVSPSFSFKKNKTYTVLLGDYTCERSANSNMCCDLMKDQCTVLLEIK